MRQPMFKQFEPVRTPFRPFPALWAAFSDDPAVIAALDGAPTFAFLDDAGRSLAVRGRDAARKFILPESA